MSQMKLYVIAAVLLLASALAGAQAEEWKEYKNADGNFAVLMPGTPMVSGPGAESGVVTLPCGLSVCTVGWGAAGTDSATAESNRSLQQKILARMGKCSQLTPHPPAVTLPGYVGRLYHASCMTPAAVGLIYDGELYVGHGRFYAVAVSRPSDLPALKEMHSYFASFRFLKAGESAPPAPPASGGVIGGIISSDSTPPGEDNYAWTEFKSVDDNFSIQFPMEKWHEYTNHDKGPVPVYYRGGKCGGSVCGVLWSASRVPPSEAAMDEVARLMMPKCEMQASPADPLKPGYLSRHYHGICERGSYLENSWDAVLHYGDKHWYWIDVLTMSGDRRFEFPQKFTDSFQLLQ